jgi:hypothetical protein
MDYLQVREKEKVYLRVLGKVKVTGWNLAPSE